MSTSEYLVTGIVPLDKKRSKIFLDGEFAFVLYKGELHSMHIAEGCKISAEQKSKIENEILLKRAKLRAMNLLKARNYTEMQLTEKLRQGYYPEEIVQLAIEYVKSFHYVDDYQYASDYIEYHFEDKPEKRLILDLQRKGITKDVIDRVLDEKKSQSNVEDIEIKMIQDFVRKKHVDLEICSWEEKQKLCASLVRKGFSYEKVCRIIL